MEARFPPVRACIFDMDGLLIDSEDKVAEAINEMMIRYSRPLLSSEMRCRLMGVPGSSNSDMFHDWANLPIPREQYAQESRKLMLRGERSKILAGRSGMFELGNEHQLGQMDDGWGECISSLRDFDFQRYGIIS
ncbi:hypothetical protein LMH87_001618 [Akanthomyces muscarius]|uniref:Uncharacterized protein n=1 Tax=Akanthomyces muscarius TaxID=2231603 RepID=A0A9W8UID8_AKAMU|nr:hypothetical protein LMH87_001618 [Akanthomyces muscarius]KAJ4147067.1 hypothetical protein LMH87_001618 [Akanthomyces muscarius]